MQLWDLHGTERKKCKKREFVAAAQSQRLCPEVGRPLGTRAQSEFQRPSRRFARYAARKESRGLDRRFRSG